MRKFHIHENRVFGKLKFFFQIMITGLWSWFLTSKSSVTAEVTLDSSVMFSGCVCLPLQDLHINVEVTNDKTNNELQHLQLKLAGKHALVFKKSIDNTAFTSTS